MGMNRHRAILDRVGGRSGLAAVLGLNPETVKSWYKRGIPARYWHRINQLAPDITPEYLAKTKPRTDQRCAAE